MSDWYKIKEIGDDIFIIEETGHVRSFLVNGEKKSILIDTGTGMADFKKAITPYARSDITVLNTHWHFDHIGSNHQFEKVGISAREEWLVEKDVPNEFMKSALQYYGGDAHLPEGFNIDAYYIRGSNVAFTISDGEIFDLGSRYLEAIATPGHSEGSMSFLDSKTGMLFCGDLLTKDEILDIQYTDSCIDEYISSLLKLGKRVSDIKVIYESHSSIPLPVDHMARTCDALMKIKAGNLGYSEEIIMGTPILIYDVEGFHVYLKKPGTKGIGFREMIE